MQPGGEAYRGASLIRKRTPIGPHRTPMPRVLEGSQGGERFRMGEVPLYGAGQEQLSEKSGAQKQRAITRMVVGFAVAVAVLRVVLSGGIGPQERWVLPPRPH